MALNIGNAAATEGLARAIYVELDKVLRPPLEASMQTMDEEPRNETIAASRAAWRNLSFAVASGLVPYVQRQEPSDVEYAEVVSSPSQDAQYWSWLSGFVQQFKDWASGSTPDPAGLKTSLNAFFAANPGTPQQLKGVIQ